MKLRLILYWLVKTIEIITRRESHPLGITTSAGGNRHRQKKVEESSEERTNFQKEGLEVEEKQHVGKISRKG